MTDGRKGLLNIIDINDDSNEILVSSAESLIHGKFKEAYDSIPVDIQALDEVELEKMINPTQIDWFLRHRLWELIEDAVASGESKVNSRDVYDGICTNGNFYNRIVTDHHKMAWMMKPIVNEKKIAKESFYILMKKTRDFIVKTNVYDKNLGEILKLLKFLSERAFGPVVHRIETKNLHVSAKQKENEPETREELEEKIKALEETYNKRASIDITPE